ncbi:MAG: hypothetical protein IJ833_09895 [Lachnospiraceae bacterium]|nr:hypothetical protein [Lachnospiraceae bacterium]
MKQKRNQKVEKNMEENRHKLTWGNLLPELFMLLVIEAGAYGVHWWQASTFESFLSKAVLLGMGMGILGFQLRQSRLGDEFDFDNREHCLRFWGCFFLAACLAFLCIFLPVGGWPFLAIFVVLALFSSMSSGIIAGTVLLLIPVLFSDATVAVFVLYFICGVFGVTLFHRLDDEFKIGIPLFLSLFCLLLCEIAGIILLQNARLKAESFVIPVTNIILSGVLLVGILKLFSASVVYKFRMKYLELNDTEHPLLAQQREASRKEYLLAIHTSYFCERIANALGMDKEALKCAGYYHGMQETLSEKEWAESFPPAAYAILQEYWHRDKGIYQKETAVLVTADTIVGTIIEEHTKNDDGVINYARVIEEILAGFERQKLFYNSNLTLHEWFMMQKIFKEEKLYYDFIR